MGAVFGEEVSGQNAGLVHGQDQTAGEHGGPGDGVVLGGNLSLVPAHATGYQCQHAGARRPDDQGNDIDVIGNEKGTDGKGDTSCPEHLQRAVYPH